MSWVAVLPVARWQLDFLCPLRARHATWHSGNLWILVRWAQAR